MTDTLVSTTFVFVKDSTSVSVGGVTSTTPTPTSDQITAVTTALGTLSTGIDSLITERGDIYFVPPAFFTARGWSAGGDAAWGYTPHKGMHFINNTLGPNAIGYAVIHELAHQVDPDKLTSAKKATLRALMVPPATGWWSGAYISEAGECFADTFVRAYSSSAAITGKLRGSSYPGGYYYQRHIADSDFATFRSTVGGAGTVYSTTLAAAVTAGATVAKVTSVANVSAGDWIQVDTGTNIEDVQVVSVGTSGSGGTGLATTPFSLSHATSAAVVATGDPAVGGGGPIDHVVTANTASGDRASDTFTGLAAGEAGTVVVRFYDGTAWGPWSDPAAVALGSTPGVTLVTATSGTLTPDFGATSTVGAITEYSAAVYQLINGVKTFNMLVEDVPVAGLPSRISIPFSNNVGPPLSWDQHYVFEISLFTGFGPTLRQSPFALLPFTPTHDVGPLITYGGNPIDLTNKIEELTPTFRLTPRAGGNIDEAQLRIWNDSGTSLLWDSGVVSFTAAAYRDIAVPTAILAWGLNIRVSGLVRGSGDSALGAESSQYQAHVNAQPGAPYPVSLVNPGQQVVQRADGVWVTTDDTPTVIFPYRDADVDLGYTDAPTQRVVELRNLADAHVGASPYIITSGITNNWDVPTGLLTLDTTFKTRANFDDEDTVPSAFSDYLFLRYSQPPTLSGVSPADVATVTDPTPTFAGTFASPSGKAMVAQQLVLSIAGAVIHDSGLVAASAPLLTVLVHVLDTAETVDYTYTVYDSDGLAGVALGTFTTAFTQPVPVNGLSVQPDLVTDSLIASWIASDDAAFEEYFVYIKSLDDQFTLVATITEIDQTELHIYRAPHNVETVVRVTQSNGWAESDPVSTSAELGDDPNTPAYISGYWLVRPEQVVYLEHATHAQGDTQTDIERFNPPLRGESVVLNWGTRGYESSITILTRDRSLLQLLRSWKEQGVVAILKTWYGAVRYVRILATPDTDQRAALISGQMTYVEIKPPADGF